MPVHRPLKRTEFFVLAALLDGPLHGYGVVSAIDEQTAGRVRLRPANLYRILDRLVAFGLLEETAPTRPPSAGARGGERTRFFVATTAGQRAAREEARLLASLIAGSRTLAATLGPARGSSQ